MISAKLLLTAQQTRFTLLTEAWLLNRHRAAQDGTSMIAYWVPHDACR
jgi:hypothetical protein